MAVTRIDSKMSTFEMLFALSDGNSEAMVILSVLLYRGRDIDPDSALGGLGLIMELDDLGIWDHRIVILMEEICHHSHMKMVALLRAVELGHLPGDKLLEAIDSPWVKLDIDSIVAKVKAERPNFDTNFHYPLDTSGRAV